MAQREARAELKRSDERAGSPERHLSKREQSIHGQFKEDKGEGLEAAH